MDDITLVYSHGIRYTDSKGVTHSGRKEIQFTVARNTDIGRVVEHIAQEEIFMLTDGSTIRLEDQPEYERFIERLTENGIVAVPIESPVSGAKRSSGRRVQRLQVDCYELKTATEVAQARAAVTSLPSRTN